MNVILALRKLIEMEEAMAAHYTELARVFATEPGTCAFFEQLAQDEQAHGRFVEFEMRLAVGNANHYGDLDLDGAQLQAALERIRGYVPPSEPLLEPALRFAYEMERSAAEAHSLNLLNELLPKLGKLLSSLDAGDRRHAQTIEKFASACGLDLNP